MALLKDIIVLGNSRFIGDVYTNRIIIEGGTSSLFLKADGSVDTNTYLKTSDISSWAKASSKPSYTLSEVGESIRVVSVSSNLTNQTTSITDGKVETVIYVNSGSTTDYTVGISSTYKTPDGNAISLTCPKNGYCEVSYVNVNGTIYARGL